MLTPMKPIDDGIKKCGSLPKLYRELVKAGYQKTQNALEKAQDRGSQSYSADLILALIAVVYAGDATKFAAAIRSETKP